MRRTFFPLYLSLFFWLHSCRCTTKSLLFSRIFASTFLIFPDFGRPGFFCVEKNCTSFCFIYFGEREQTKICNIEQRTKMALWFSSSMPVEPFFRVKIRRNWIFFTIVSLNIFIRSSQKNEPGSCNSIFISFNRTK